MFKFLSLLVLAVCLTYGGILYQPGIFFDNRFERGSFVIVSRSPTPVSAELFMEKALDKLKNSQLYSEGRKFEVYVAASAEEYAFFAPFCRKAYACQHPFKDIIFMAPVNFEKGLVASPLDPKNKFALDKLLAREAVMLQMREKMGALTYAMAASWKKEGYSGQVIFSDDKESNPSDICKSDAASSPYYDSYLNKLVVEYMMAEEKMDLDDILFKDFDPEPIVKILKARYCS
ncbi:MAG TPA: hypothetical protein DCL44_04560 [Elusimicrobia bacterium]|nr:hypothetical protein [Elusimicrobiota bacterium]